MQNHIDFKALACELVAPLFLTLLNVTKREALDTQRFKGFFVSFSYRFLLYYHGSIQVKIKRLSSVKYRTQPFELNESNFLEESYYF